MGIMFFLQPHICLSAYVRRVAGTGPSLRASRAGCVPAPCRLCMLLDHSTWLACLDSGLCVLSSQCSVLTALRSSIVVCRGPSAAVIGLLALGSGGLFQWAGALLGPAWTLWQFLAFFGT